MKTRFFAVAVATLLAMPASAATLVYDYGTKPGSQALDLFNPALGTLLSVKGEFNGSEIISFNTNLTTPTLVNYTGSGFYSVYIGPLFFDFSATGAGSVNVGVGPAQITLSGGTSQTRSSPFELAIFTGVGTILGSPTTDPANIMLSSGFVTEQSLVSKATSFKITYTYDPVLAPIPEPASWAMMIVGFGAAGAVIRRRRMRTAFA